MLSLLLTTAMAAKCDEVYTSDQLLADIAVSAEALRAGESDLLMGAGQHLEKGIACMAEPMPPAIFARVYRQIGVAKVAGEKDDDAALWFRTARELEPTYKWDILDVPPGSHTWDVYEDARSYEATAPVALEGMELAVPAGSRIFIDGRRLTEAAATIDRLHVIQQVGSDGAVRNSWIVKGNRLPGALVQEALMTANEEDAVVQDKKDEERDARRRKDPVVLSGGYTTDDTVLIQRERPPLKTPLLVVGGAGLLAAGGVYAASYSARTGFDDATTERDLDAARALTNTLVMASGGVLLVGVGVSTWGMLLDGGGAVGMTMEF